ncbi:FGGY family carbohydrate kinase [Micromonospora globbae]|uniref:FGGY family carbohydrate kinase n=1 Tax=Micromonospora globbae TaxID=1894969 RepID=A0ABZ1SDB8_9ACTN|nr:FGGY family carbohydrate kinase [Micromonospora globbae]
MTDVVLALDLGTGGGKAALVDADARVVRSTFVPYPTSYPAPGRHEQRPEDWWAAVVRSCRDLLDADAGRHRVTAVGLSGHSLAMVPVGADGSALLDSVPIWSDTRGEAAAAAHFAAGGEDEWYTTTGNGFPRGMYTVFKAGWLRAEHPDLAARTTRLLGSKDWVNARLTGVECTDPSYASGSGAYDLRARTMSADLLARFDVPARWWPEVVASTTVIGTVTAEAAAATGLPAGVPVVAGGVDNSCMALGAGLDRAGAAYLSLGSSNWVTVAGPDPVLDPVTRPFVFDHVLPGLYISALSTFGGGSSLQWLATLLGRGDDIDALLDEAAAAPVGANGLTCVPTLAGGTVAEGGPAVRGAFLGLDLGHSHGDLARALIEGIGFSLADAAATMLAAVPAHPAGERPAVTATGGGARGRLMLQVLADLLDRPLARPDAAQHAAALGAGALALLGIGAWSDTAPLREARREALRVDPRPDLADAYALPRLRFDAARDATRRHAAATSTPDDHRI